MLVKAISISLYTSMDTSAGESVFIEAIGDTPNRTNLVAIHPHADQIGGFNTTQLLRNFSLRSSSIAIAFLRSVRLP